MKRRALSLTLALVLLICLIPVSAFAVQTRETSSACVSVIKHFEGFSKYPYWDNTQYTVGYGTRCPDSKLAYYQKYGITESEATKLLKKFIDSFEVYVNDFAQDNGLNLTQSQFDALVSFTYNLGPAWMKDKDNLITQAVLNGDKGNDFIFALAMWCVSDGAIRSGLIERRLVEANMYLYNSYTTTLPDYMGYVTFNYIDSTYNGENKTISIQGYNAAETDEVRSVPKRSGYRFLGWYTASSGGKWVSHLDATTSGKKLYARWQSGDGKVSGGVIQGTKASYERVTDGSVKVYSKPSTSSTVKYTLSDDTVVSIVADYVTSGGTKWGKLSDGCWLKLGSTDPVLNPAKGSYDDGIIVTVTADRLSVRSGAGTGYSRVRYAYEGEQMLITQVRDVSGTPWGKFADGWVCLTYTDYSGQDEEVIATGTVNSHTGNLNIRSGAGSSYSKVGALSNGDRVEIYEIKTVGSTKWGRISKGWISLTYVDLDSAAGSTPEQKPETVIATGTVTSSNLNIRSAAGASNTKVGTLSKGDKVEIYEIKTVGSSKWGRISKGWISLDYVKLDSAAQAPDNDTVVATGTVTSSNLNIRSGAGTSYSKVGALSKGDKVEIYETVTAGGSKWGRISKGWICLTYVKLDTGDTETADPVTGVVNTKTVDLKVRSGPGTTYSIVTTLPKGTTVTIYETKTVSGTEWGRIDKGWICMDYIKLTDGSTGSSNSGSQTTSVKTGTRSGTVINCDTLNVRSGAGTSYDKTATVEAGSTVTVTDMKLVNGMVWGKISSGWVSLYYVDLDDITAGSLAMVDNSSLNIRSGAGASNDKVGTYKEGDVVVILETKTVGSEPWGKTDKGWISLEYLL